MMSTFTANFIYAQADDENDVLMIGFADDQYDPQEYILLQLTMHPDEQDLALGFDKIHMTYNDESQSQYGGIEKVLLKPGSIEIYLDEEAIEALDCEAAVVRVNFDPDVLNLEERRELFEQMFGELLEIDAEAGLL
ncbi:Imm10 family immunity protein [Paenibacillus sp. FSL R7-0331]|uniref:Imm10 family immunity protein n=1 Tax=Paenibacillus sp. FSL R7-0331 TaxID=1536773 RepID=UPI0009DDE5FD|nr:Imm10 family immunity protein [Paenibacillus sp. FSL R7-0331]